MRKTSEQRFCDICGKDMGTACATSPAEKGIYEDGQRWRVQIGQYHDLPGWGKPGFRLMDLCDYCLGEIVEFVKAKLLKEKN